MHLLDIFISDSNLLNWIVFGLIMGIVVPFIYFKPNIKHIFAGAITGIFGSLTGGFSAVFILRFREGPSNFNLTLLLISVFASIIFLTVLRLSMQRSAQVKSKIKNKKN